MSTQKRAFRPLAVTQNIAVTNATQQITLNYTNGYRALRLVNSGTDTIFVHALSSTAAVTATTAASMPILPNTADWITVAPEVTVIAVIGAAGGLSTLYVTVGEGF